MTHAEAVILLADCNTINKYADLLNMTFNVRFVGRVVEWKALIDAQILRMHPHLSPVIGYYKMFILRYYTPMWHLPGFDKPDGEQGMMMNGEGISTDTDV